MPLDSWNTILQNVALVAAVVAVLAGAGALVTGRSLARREAERLGIVERQLMIARAELKAVREPAEPMEPLDAQDRAGVSTADDSVARVLAEAAAANERAAATEREAAELRSLAERERHARARIEERLGDRRLDERERAPIVTALRKHPGVHAVVVANQASVEGMQLATDIVAVLDAAQWASYIDPQFAIRPLAGVLVEIDRSAAAPVAAAATALVASLKSAGVATSGPAPANDRVVRLTGSSRPGADGVAASQVITITIGTKP